MPDISCSFTYFPPANFLSVHGSNQRSAIVAKGGGGFIISQIGERPYIPIAMMKFNAGTGVYEYSAIAVQIAQMPNLIIKYFTADLNASVNYATDNFAGADQWLIPVGYFGSYLFKRVFSDSTMSARYFNLANIIAQFWQYADPAWTTAQMVNAINNFKSQLIQYLADPNLYLSPQNLDVGAASVLTIAITAAKVADANFAYFDNIEIYTA